MINFDLKDRVAIVTGGAQGFGLAITERFIASGASVVIWDIDEEAIKIANDTPYGLTNYIQTQDKEKVKRVARKLRSGMVDVNGAGIAVDAPFGGFKHSGIGREAGEHGLEEFLEVKAVGGWNN